MRTIDLKDGSVRIEFKGRKVMVLKSGLDSGIELDRELVKIKYLKGNPVGVGVSKHQNLEMWLDTRV